MARLSLIFCLLAAHVSFSQPAHVSLEDKNHTLNERYYLMKSSSQTFQDYKVIKEFVLDGVWKIMMDSIKGQRVQLAQARESIIQLEAKLQAVELTLKKERDASAQVAFDSTHITLLGIGFEKRTFITLMTFLMAGFVLAIVFMAGRMKLTRAIMKEKVVIADLISHEYEEFKRKALDKQTKLSRELQNERNKLEELKTKY